MATMEERLDALEAESRKLKSFVRNIGVITNGGCCPRHQFDGRLPLASEDWSREQWFMLASYCYDVLRRVEYLYAAATGIDDVTIENSLAQQVHDDEARLNDKATTWEEEAREGELIVRELPQRLYSVSLISDDSECIKRLAARAALEAGETPPADAAGDGAGDAAGDVVIPPPEE